MDMITTGRTALDRDLAVQLVDEIRNYCRQKHSGSSVRIGTIVQDLLKQMSAHGGGGLTVNNEQVVQAVEELMAEGLVQFNKYTNTVTVLDTINHNY